MYAEVHERTFNEDRALRERVRWLEAQHQDMQANAFLTPVKVSLLPVGHMACLCRRKHQNQQRRQVSKATAQDQSAGGGSVRTY